jgi:hypothetical protein
MDRTNSILEEVLKAVNLNFRWDQFTHTWQLEKRANGHTWRSVMYRAQDQRQAEEEAVKHIYRFYYH